MAACFGATSVRCAIGSVWTTTLPFLARMAYW